MAIQPRTTLIAAIRMVKLARSITSGGPQIVYRFLHNQDRPDRAFTTERAKRAGMANASSGRIFVTIPKDHFGPIPAENDPERNQGVLVRETWDLRMDCRQWGVYYPPVAGIGGRAHYGAHLVVISGGYEDDEDCGEWFIYTGSDGQDLSGNKRTNKEQSFDQEFKEGNQALRVSCDKGYPVRTIRDTRFADTYLSDVTMSQCHEQVMSMGIDQDSCQTFPSLNTQLMFLKVWKVPRGIMITSTI
ncbi:E3 ubiquitin-protein ligase ORTHRUS 2-like isoform X2 [Primulina huaijiensis]|uniref:E3 ubiquitin-protein ligase ORTHRUS 2-like isoform X2 n=1 Tax=Primulina huaijiensis TaxID=1492673 RepID=UPI003CC79772